MIYIYIYIVFYHILYAYHDDYTRWITSQTGCLPDPGQLILSVQTSPCRDLTEMALATNDQQVSELLGCTWYASMMAGGTCARVKYWYELNQPMMAHGLFGFGKRQFCFQAS